MTRMSWASVHVRPAIEPGRIHAVVVLAGMTPVPVHPSHHRRAGREPERGHQNRPLKSLHNSSFSRQRVYPCSVFAYKTDESPGFLRHRHGNQNAFGARQMTVEVEEIHRQTVAPKAHHRVKLRTVLGHEKKSSGVQSSGQQDDHNDDSHGEDRRHCPELPHNYDLIVTGFMSHNPYLATM